MRGVNPVRREFGESIGFFLGVALYFSGVKNADGDLAWTVIAFWPLFAFTPLIVGPKFFRVPLILIGLALAIGYGLGNVTAGLGVALAGVFLTPRTQRALGVLRLALAAVVIALYIYVPFAEPSLGTGGAVLLLPIALPVVACLLARSRAFLQAGAANQWYVVRWLQYDNSPQPRVEDLNSQR